MVDPIISPLLLASVVGAGASAATGLIGNKGAGGSPALPEATPPLAPATQPTTAKPKATGMQQSFLSGVAGAQLPGAGTQSGGKTLLGS